jgi:hypothetical protein
MSERELFNLADKVTRRLLKQYAPHLSGEDTIQMTAFANQCRTYANRERRNGRP